MTHPDVPQQPAQDEHREILSAENPTEMARLLEQDKIITEGMGGLFPERSDAEMDTLFDVLDLASGPGAWAQDVAQSYPEIELIAVDISPTTVEYANASARLRGLTNVQFRVMDINKPLAFPDDSFDLVNGRGLFTSVPRDGWPDLLAECRRVLRPGGVMRLTESGGELCNSEALERLCTIALQAMLRSGRSFSPTGVNTGILQMFGPFLRRAGFQDIKFKAHVYDHSFGTPGHRGIYENFRILFKLVQPFWIAQGVTTQEEIDPLYEQAMNDMQSEDFCGLSLGLTVWGIKPQTER